MDEALEADADGILLAPANSNSLVESCEKAREDKIPLVRVDSSVNSEAFDACCQRRRSSVSRTGRGLYLFM